MWIDLSLEWRRYGKDTASECNIEIETSGVFLFEKNGNLGMIHYWALGLCWLYHIPAVQLMVPVKLLRCHWK